ncbi:MAG: conjugal transfer protein TraD [Gammaproteobacteria bacterium]|nr:conjugal transfer protein TraD [Gammaproteobacteria bacterium]
MQERKQDTRKKIQLGGLIKKVGLHEEPTAVLLGLLLEAKDNLESSTSDKFREAYRLRGDIAFTNERSGAGKDHP